MGMHYCLARWDNDARGQRTECTARWQYGMALLIGSVALHCPVAPWDCTILSQCGTTVLPGSALLCCALTVRDGIAHW